MARIGLLECDHVDERRRSIAGDYFDMFAALLPSVDLVRYDSIGGTVPESVDECEGWVVTGSRHSVYDDLDWIKQTGAFVAQAHGAEVPVVGVCFGHQLLAHFVGGRTEKAATGWGTGAHDLSTGQRLLFMHQDQVVLLPAAAKVVASTDHCANAVLTIGASLGIQAHPEFTTGYAEALLTARVERLGEDVVEAALATLDAPRHEDVAAGWMLRTLTRWRDTLCVAVDQGTTDVKVGLVTLAGDIVWRSHAGVTTDFGPNGQATQDATEWWTIVTRLLAEGLATVDRRDITAVCCTGMWSSTVPVDADGAPVGPASTWLDTQGAAHSRNVIAGPIAGFKPVPAVRWLRKTGAAPSSSGADPIGHMLHLRHERPDVHAAARWYLEPVDYLALRFTGVAAASHASMTGAWLTDNRRPAVLDYDDALVTMAGIDRSKLPPLVPTGSVVGLVREGLGLPATTKVVTGLPDLHTAAVGAGAVAEYATHLAISTSAWISCPVPFKKTDIAHQIASLPGLRPGEYLVGNNHETAGRCLQWFRDTFLPGTPFEDVTALAATAPAGAGRVLFAPWLVGERSPVDDRNARAGFHNVSIDATLADLARAVLEGVAFNARWLHEHVERFCKRRLDPIRIFGGGAVSDLWCQIHADVLDRTIERVAEPRECGIRGAALFAGLSLGAVTHDEIASLVRVERTFVPDPATRAVYDRLFPELPKLYKAQKGMFARLNRR